MTSDIAGHNPADAQLDATPAMASSDPASAFAESAAAEVAAEARRARLGRLMPRTLTGRLVFGVAALVLVVVIAVSAATFVGLRSFLSSRLDEQLVPLAGANASRISSCVKSPIRVDESGNSICPLGPGSNGYRSPQKQWIVVISPTGGTTFSVENSSPDLVGMTLSDSARAALVSDPTSTRTVTTTDGSQLRVSARTVVSSAGTYVVATGLSTADERRTLNQLLWLEVVIGLVALVVSVGVTTFGMRLGLRPLRRITRTAHEMAAELSPQGAGLDRRIEVSGPGNSNEVGQLAHSLNTLLAEVQAQFTSRIESEDRLRQFVADASHELRTPLTSIRGYAELARLSRSTEDPAAMADTLRRIETEGTRMSRLVQDLLTLARTDHGAVPQRQPVDVADVVSDAVQGVQAAYPDRPIEVRTTAGLVVFGDADQLLRVVRNLLTNAAVHTAPGGPIRISSYHEAGYQVIRIDDSGPGLPPEEARHIFERFWRSDKARTRANGGGTGLGMAIVASIVQSHGGVVSFDSSPETGSTVIVRLPG